MNSNFFDSRTRINLMRAFAGESQARNRYTFARQAAIKANLYAISEIFHFTANQEKEHAEIFYNLLKEENGKTVEIDGGFPVGAYENVLELLEDSVHNEDEENQIIYPDFADVASSEGIVQAASKFSLIAKIEKSHSERFKYYAELMKNDKLFRSDKTEKWLCLNCGNIHESSEAPTNCPVCGKNQGYFIRVEEAPFTFGGMICRE